MKRCFKCGETKPIDEFYRHPEMADGHLNKCKSCNRKDVIENRQKRLDYYREYDRTRGTAHHRVKARAAYRQTEAGREAKRRGQAKWDELNKHKKACHAKVQRAIRSGKLTKQPCELCGEQKSEAHHADYTKPLDVQWLCPSHHVELHKKQREVERAKSKQQ